MINTQFPEPNRPSNLPSHAQWLAGRDTGQWFIIDEHQKGSRLYRIRRIGIKGDLQFDRLFFTDQVGFIVSKPYEFTHLSHGKYCSISQNNKLYRFSLFQSKSEDGLSIDKSTFGNN
jgi:hypothetical protein